MHNYFLTGRVVQYRLSVTGVPDDRQNDRMVEATSMLECLRQDMTRRSMTDYDVQDVEQRRCLPVSTCTS